MRLNYQLTGGVFQRLELSQTRILIGRSSECEIRVVDESISRKHCLIEVIDGQVYLTDLDSANGVYIDGKRIEAGTPVHYPTYLSLSIGPQLTVSIESIDDSSQAGFALRDAAETRANNIERKRKQASSPVATQKTSPKDGGSLLLVIAALVILIGGVYMFFEFRDQITSSKIQKNPRPKTQAPVQDLGNF